VDAVDAIVAPDVEVRLGRRPGDVGKAPSELRSATDTFINASRCLNSDRPPGLRRFSTV